VNVKNILSNEGDEWEEWNFVQRNMLCICLDYNGPIYYEILQRNERINSEKYCALDILKTTFQEKRPALSNSHGIVFQHDKSIPHVSVSKLQRLKVFGWNVLNHPSYFPDIAPTDYYLFRSLERSIHGMNFVI